LGGRDDDLRISAFQFFSFSFLSPSPSMSPTQRRKPQTDTDDHTTVSKATPTSVKAKDNGLTVGKVVKTGIIALGWVVAFFFLGSYLLTESWTWGYRGKWTNLHTYLPVSLHQQ
jgi:hypothetical protein